MNPTFSVNLYDRDGDAWDDCVLLHLENGTILRFENSQELEDFANKILALLPEVRENEAMR